jgi:hypothetical protein
MSGNSGNNARDNRQRGNAAQLLEKYKSMARDAQLAGDRVQTEYFLQFADHYFRVLEENRSRFDEQPQNQANRRRREDEEDEYDGDEEMSADSEGEDDGEVRQAPRRDRDRFVERTERPVRAERPERAPRPERSERADRDDRPQRDRPNGRAREEAFETDERISLGVLPPAIGAVEDEPTEEAPKPRRRVRKPRAEDGDEIAPAA